MISHLLEILDAIIESIISKMNAMPYLLRTFIKILFEECSKKYEEEYGKLKMYNIIAEFLISKWLMGVCFLDLSKHGLTKDFYLGENCKDNFRLIGKVRYLLKHFNSTLDHAKNV